MVTVGEVRRAKAKAVGGKKDRCKKGKSCSATCISGWKACLVEMSAGISSSVTQVREKVKGRVRKVVPGVKGLYLRGQRNEYFKTRDRLISQMEGSLLRGNVTRYSNLVGRLDKLEKEVGSKLGIEKSPPMSYDKRSRLETRRSRYMEVKNSLLRQAVEASSGGKRGTYEKLEDRLLRLQQKGGSKFGDSRIFSKGEIWTVHTSMRLSQRKGAFTKAQDRLLDLMRKAAKDGDRKEYVKLERGLFLIQKRTGDKLGSSVAFDKNEIWRRMRIEGAKDALKNKLVEAIATDNRATYDKLMGKLERINSKSGSRQSVGDLWDKYQGLAQLVYKLNNSSLMNKENGVSSIEIKHDTRYGQSLEVISRVLGNKLGVHASPDSFSFKVNDSYLASDNLSRRETFAIIKEVRRQFNKIVENMGDGMAIMVEAAEGDGKEGTRQKGYTGFGFSDPDRRGYMYGIVRRGKMTPSNESEFDANTVERFRVS